MSERIQTCADKTYRLEYLAEEDVPHEAGSNE